jgi:hypothetical protein
LPIELENIVSIEEEIFKEKRPVGRELGRDTRDFGLDDTLANKR